MRKQKRAYKYRISPTEEQKHLLAQTFGCCRFVYNWGLATRKNAYFQYGQKLTYNDLSALLPSLKKEYPWLADGLLCAHSAVSSPLGPCIQELL